MNKHFVSPYVYIGYSCNNNCIFCSESDEYLENLQKKDSKEIKKEIKIIRGRYDFMSFMGREPTLRPDFFDLLAFAKTLDFRQISIATNGRLFAYPAFVKRIMDCGVNQVGVSFNSSNAKIHDLLTACPGSFKQTIQGIRNLVALHRKDLSVLINIPLTQKNYLTLESTIDLLIEIGIKEINILWVAPLSRRSRTKDIICDMSSLGRYVAGVLKKAKYKKSPVKFLLVEFLPCSLPKEARELFFPCLENNPEKTRISLCSQCQFADKCNGVLKSYIDLYGIKGFKL